MVDTSDREISTEGQILAAAVTLLIQYTDFTDMKVTKDSKS